MATRSFGSDIVAITETWMRPEHNIVDFNEYTSYRQDRVDGRQGGGVLLLVRAYYSQWAAAPAQVTPNIQATACYICLERQPLGVLCVYRSPLATRAEDMELIATMQEFLSRTQRMVIVGDFNLPEVNWMEQHAPRETTGEALLEWIQAHGLRQHVIQATRFRAHQRPSLLDLVITRYDSDIGAILVEEPIGKSDHVVVKIVLCVKHGKHTDPLVRCYSQMDEVALQNAAEQLVWIPESRDPTVEERWALIKNGLTKLTEEFAPLRPRRKRHRPPWWKPRIDRAIRARRRCWARYKTYNTFQAWDDYKKTRNKAQALQREAKYSYESKLAQEVKQNPKRYYAYVQSNKHMREGVGTLDMLNDNIALTNQDKAKTLLEFFKSVYRQPGTGPTSDTSMGGADIPTIMEIRVEEADVARELGKLNPHKTAGPDGMHPAIVRPLVGALISPVTQLFAQSLSTGVLPNDWRTATVVAIHKMGSKQRVENYRPVSLTSVFSKCLERIVRRHICLHLTANRLIDPAQHGFMEKRSCLTNLLAYLDEVTRRLDEGLRVEACYLDFSKAFDSVNHCLLALKMHTLGIRGRVSQWVSQFLSNRTFSVKVGDCVTEPATVTSGVPQGSVIGPMLFLIYINDLARELKNPCFMFADDVKIAGIDLQHDIEVVQRWSEKWDLPLNPDKCQLLTTRVVQDTGINLKPVSKVKDLGVLISNDFKPGLQCQNAANKARSELFRLRARITCREPKVFLAYYKAIVRPHLEYCVQAWAPYYQKDIACLERVQQLATRMINGQRGKSYEQRLQDLDLFSMSHRRMRGDLIETFKIVKGLSGLKFDDLFSFIPSMGTRGHTLRLQRNHSRLQQRAQYFTNRVIPVWNRLPEIAVGCSSVDTFKKVIDKYWHLIDPGQSVKQTVEV